MSPPIHYFNVSSVHPPPSPAPSFVVEAEKRIGYTFRNWKFLEHALTHTSCPGSTSYERLEFLGDPILGIAISNHLFVTYPNLDPGKLSLLRAANISTEKLARVAVRLNLHTYLRHTSPPLLLKFKEFEDAVAGEDDPVCYGGLVKAPKVLADVVESVVAAIYVDNDFDLKRLWVIIRDHLKLFTPDDLEQKPQPVSLLFELCQKNGKQLDIEHWRNGDRSIVSVHVDGQFLVSAAAEQREIAKLDAARAALHKLSHLVPVTRPFLGGSFEIEAAKQALHEICGKKKWSKPDYSIDNESGPPHERRYTCSVRVTTEAGAFEMTGEEKQRVKQAENSVASLMIRALQERNYLGY